MSNPDPKLGARSGALPSLLIVDDDALIADTLAFALGAEYSIHTSETREEAIALIRQLAIPPELALVDLGLPPTPHVPDQGLRLIAELLAHAPSMKIFVLSGQNASGHARHARALGATEFIATGTFAENARTGPRFARSGSRSRLQSGRADRCKPCSQPIERAAYAVCRFTVSGPDRRRVRKRQRSSRTKPSCALEPVSRAFSSTQLCSHRAHTNGTHSVRLCKGCLYGRGCRQGRVF